MNRHPLDATALIFGLLFALSGVAIVSDEAWPDIDTTAVLGATVGVLGLGFIATLVLRQLREGSQPPAVEPVAPPNVGVADDAVSPSA
ncbi:MAG: hypothetical protein AAGE98_02645 [Actinomycetota bacterium]